MNTKAGQMKRLLERLVDHPKHDADLTTFVVGDLNSPSHLDWRGNKPRAERWIHRCVAHFPDAGRVWVHRCVP